MNVFSLTGSSLAGSCADYFAGARATHEFAAAIRTNRIHRFRAIVTKRAFVDTNVGFAIRRKRSPALFAHFFHFQRHTPLSGVISCEVLSRDFLCNGTAVKIKRWTCADSFGSAQFLLSCRFRCWPMRQSKDEWNCRRRVRRR